jgi:molybdenum cofactor guanylyltransferase
MIGVVLAGGASSRFGGRPKGLIPLAGRAMALRAADLLMQFCSRVLIEAPPNAGYEVLGLPLVHAPTEHAGKGPLAGMAAGLAAGGPRVAFAPCDMPLLTPEIFKAMTGAAGSAPGIYAATAKGVEPLVAILNAEMRQALLEALKSENLPRTHAVLDAAGARQMAFADPAPFENINTPADLQQLERHNFPSSHGT